MSIVALAQAFNAHKKEPLMPQLMCSTPGCDEEAVGRILSPATRVKDIPRETLRAIKKNEEAAKRKPPGAIGLKCLHQWFPDKDDKWLIAWLDRQDKHASTIFEADRKAAHRRVVDNIDKRKTLRGGIMRGVRNTKARLFE